MKGTQTEKHILTAFSGESQAGNRYDFFSSQAKKEDFEQISAIFAETADNETVPAKRLFKFLADGDTNEKCPRDPPTPPRTTAPSA